MTVYEAMTISIESFERGAAELILSGDTTPVLLGMIAGAKHQRDILTIEAAECEVY